MGSACIIPCSIETGCAIASSSVAIGAKSYEIYKLRKRSNSVPIPKNYLPPITRQRRIRNNTE